MALTDDQIRSGATLLAEARRSGTLLDGLGDNEPTTVAEAEAMADLNAEILGWEVVGWKLGCTSLEAQQILSSPGPFAGRMYAPTAFVDGHLPANALQRPIAECEFGFVTGADVAPSDRSWNRADLLATIESIVPTIEFVDSRFQDFAGAGYLNHTADHGANGGFICGSAVRVADVGDLATTAVSVVKNGTEVKEGTGAAVMDSPWHALGWLYEHLGQRGINLPAGSVISSGTCTGVIPVDVGDTVTASFAEIGDVTVARS